jgi:hypothetical protein
VPVTRNRSDQFDVKVDHNLFNGFTIFGRYSFRDTNQFQPAPRPGLAEGSTNDTYGYALLRSQGIAAGGTWVINPVLVSETRVGYSRGDYQQLPPNYNSGCPDVLIGLKGRSSDRLCGGLPHGLAPAATCGVSAAPLRCRRFRPPGRITSGSRSHG